MIDYDNLGLEYLRESLSRKEWLLSEVQRAKHPALDLVYTLDSHIDAIRAAIARKESQK